MNYFITGVLVIGLAVNSLAAVSIPPAIQQEINDEMEHKHYHRVEILLFQQLQQLEANLPFTLESFHPSRINEVKQFFNTIKNTMSIIVSQEETELSFWISFLFSFKAVQLFQKSAIHDIPFLGKEGCGEILAFLYGLINECLKGLDKVSLNNADEICNVKEKVNDLLDLLSQFACQVIACFPPTGHHIKNAGEQQFLETIEQLSIDNAFKDSLRYTVWNYAL